MNPVKNMDQLAKEFDEIFDEVTEGSILVLRYGDNVRELRCSTDGSKDQIITMLQGMLYHMDDSLKAGVKVLWRGKEYTTGNRMHDKVELYDDSLFVRVVNIKSVKKI